MSGFPPASVAICRRLWRARLLALCGGLTCAGPAFAQIPAWTADEEQPAVSDSLAPATPPEPTPAPKPPEDVPLEALLTPVAKDHPADAGGSERENHVPLRYTLEAVQIRGNTRTERRVVLRYVPFKPGNVFDVDDPEVELSRYRLLGTGFFRDVQYSLKKGSARGMVVLVIDVTERNTIVINDISMGLAADAGRNGRVRRLSGYAGLDVAETNLAGTGITPRGAP